MASPWLLTSSHELRNLVPILQTNGRIEDTYESQKQLYIVRIKL